MNPLSGIQWIIAGVVLAAILAGGAALHHDGFKAGKEQIQREWDDAKAAQQLVVNKQLQDTQTELARQLELNKKAEVNYATLKNANTDLANRLTHSLQQYAAAARGAGSSPVPTAAPDPAGASHTSSGPGSAGEAAELAGLTSDVVKACYADAAQLRALLDTLN